MKEIDLNKYHFGMTVYAATRHLWKCEIAENVFDERLDGRKMQMVRAIPDDVIAEFMQVVNSHPIEDLTSGQAYHDKRKKLIVIVVKPIKTKFITNYYMRSSEGSVLFPGYDKGRTGTKNQ